jgi:uncharacterized protein (DUF2235 family)
MKRLAVFMDGTWQRLAQPDPTNIAKLAQSVAHADESGVQQIVYYNRGVGALSEAEAKPGRQFIGGITGEGVEDSISDAYLFLSWNYTSGDEIYIFGFSRGAFAARSLSGLIRNSGLLHRIHAEKAELAFDHYRRKEHPDSDDFVLFRRDYSYDPIPINYIGIFDTVGQRGVPSNLGPIAWLLNRKLQFHDLNLSSLVKSARHACAIDEQRSAFPVTPWDNLDVLNKAAGFDPSDPNAPYQQRWFPGSHGEIGGGVGSSLANIPMKWIAEGAERAGLAFRKDDCWLSKATAPEALDPCVSLIENKGLLSMLGKRYRTLRRYRRPSKPSPADVQLILSEAAIRRWRADQLQPPYRPPPLKRYATFLDQADGGSPPPGA